MNIDGYADTVELIAITRSLAAIPSSASMGWWNLGAAGTDMRGADANPTPHDSADWDAATLWFAQRYRRFAALLLAVQSVSASSASSSACSAATRHEEHDRLGTPRVSGLIFPVRKRDSTRTWAASAAQPKRQAIYCQPGRKPGGSSIWSTAKMCHPSRHRRQERCSAGAVGSSMVTRSR